MKLLNRLRELRKETNNDDKNMNISINNQHQDLLGIGATTSDDILRLNIADTHHTNLYCLPD